MTTEYVPEDHVQDTHECSEGKRQSVLKILLFHILLSVVAERTRDRYNRVQFRRSTGIRLIDATVATELTGDAEDPSRPAMVGTVHVQLALGAAAAWMSARGDPPRVPFAVTVSTCATPARSRFPHARSREG